MYFWTDLLFRALPRLAVAATLGVLLCMNAYAAKQSWPSLTINQREALAPIAQQWDTLPEMQQKRLLFTTKGFHKLSPAKKQLFHNRLVEWSKLTPEQRNRVREKYKAFKKISPEKREEVKRLVLQQEAIKEKARQEAEAAAATSTEEVHEDEDKSP